MVESCFRTCRGFVTESCLFGTAINIREADSMKTLIVIFGDVS